MGKKIKTFQATPTKPGLKTRTRQQYYNAFDDYLFTFKSLVPENTKLVYGLPKQLHTWPHKLSSNAPLVTQCIWIRLLVSFVRCERMPKRKCQLHQWKTLYWNVWWLWMYMCEHVFVRRKLHKRWVCRLLLNLFCFLLSYAQIIECSIDWSIDWLSEWPLLF